MAAVAGRKGDRPGCYQVGVDKNRAVRLVGQVFPCKGCLAGPVWSGDDNDFLSGIQIRPYLLSARGTAILLIPGGGCVGMRHFDVTVLQCRQKISLPQ